MRVSDEIINTTVSAVKTGNIASVDGVGDDVGVGIINIYLTAPCSIGLLPPIQGNNITVRKLSSTAPVIYARSARVVHVVPPRHCVVT